MVITMSGIIDAVHHPKIKPIKFRRLDLSPYLVRERDRKNLFI
jgi:hypothetical protein